MHLLAGVFDLTRLPPREGREVDGVVAEEEQAEEEDDVEVDRTLPSGNEEDEGGGEVDDGGVSEVVPV